MNLNNSNNSAEKDRLNGEDYAAWHKWGPYVSERQWGTVREDYSANGDAWDYITHDSARSRAYRWGEEGIGGICDNRQMLCFSLALWNGRDPILKERLFGLNGYEGNHGEDVKEYYYYLDSSPTHSYMKMLYKYPQAEFPYSFLVETNMNRGKLDPEFELVDTSIFAEDKYFDIFIEYAKAEPEDILIKITAYNRSNESAFLNLLPQIWFRNTWAWGNDDYKPFLKAVDENMIAVSHTELGNYSLCCDGHPKMLFCDNETNSPRLFKVNNAVDYFKDGINDFIVSDNKDAVNPERSGTKAGLSYEMEIPALGFKSARLRLTNKISDALFNDFESTFEKRKNETDIYYNSLQKGISDHDAKLVQRQAFAGMLWGKQFYCFDVMKWLKGDPKQPEPPADRLNGRNNGWFHLNNNDIISMPDKWEYPWYAAWDLAFHCIPFALIDPVFAKGQLKLLTREWYMHPNGQLPAYEWNFSNVNPPVHAWATWRVYKIDKKLNQGKGDTAFLETVFHKLLLNFTWWVNRKDLQNHNIFEGGFLGLDNIGLFDRNEQIPADGRLEQADATAWMAMFSLNMLRIALELSKVNHVYEEMATKFLEHFLFIAGAMTNIDKKGINLWDDDDEFFYDVLHTGKRNTRLKIRSMIGLIPLFAVEVIDPDTIKECPEFAKRMDWFLEYRSDLSSLVSRWTVEGEGDTRLFSLLRGHRLKRLLYRMLDESEFLSEYGIRALSKYHENHPYEFDLNGQLCKVNYEPAESENYMFGGNSNWRGPIWIPMNFLIIESLQRFHHYYGDDFKVEYPTHSGKYISLLDISIELTNRLSKIFLKDNNGFRPVFGNNLKFNSDPYFNDYLLFYEYFHGDNGHGLGASHQTGWTGLISKLLQPRNRLHVAG
jgi:hypothetical protein